jgi:2,3-dihydroxy-2,3-dihydrophenylpropionate dehydrogenase
MNTATTDDAPTMREPRSVLITGGSSGIGAAVAAEFRRLGDTVTVFDRQAPSGPLGDEVRVVIGDVTDPRDNEKAVAVAVEATGELDVFVGNAGIHDGGLGLLDGTAEDLARVMTEVLRVDVVGYVLGARAAADALRGRRGCMIFTLSDASYVVQGNGAGIAYTAAKHAALGVVRHLAATLAPEIRVNAVAPGGIVTGLKAVVAGGTARDVFADAAAVTAAVRELNPLNVVLSPAEIAATYAFLASPGAAAMTGEVLRPDGGLSVR